MSEFKLVRRPTCFACGSNVKEAQDAPTHISLPIAQYNANIDRAVSTAIRDTKLSIAQKLYDTAKKYQDAVDNPKDVLHTYFVGVTTALRLNANRLVLEAMGWEGI